MEHDSWQGHPIDLSTQLWVRATGRTVAAGEHAWLDGPIGRPAGIGPEYFERLAEAEGLALRRHTSGRGLLPSFDALAGPDFDPARIRPEVAEFYERTAEFDVDVWSEWAAPFRPFGALVARTFSRRLRQLNLPLSPLDASQGMTSAILELADPATGEVRHRAWLRTLIKTGQVVYAGTYSVARPPGEAGPCVKVVFPLPNGNAVVLLRPEADDRGALTLNSSGRRFGDAGFYFTARDRRGRARARFVRSFRERIRVYVADDGVLRTDHEMSLWGLTCLRLHYRLRRPEPTRAPDDGRPRADA